MATVPGSVLLATVAIEPNRWSTLDPTGAPAVEVSPFLDAIAGGGFDGLEVWDRHLVAASDAEFDRVVAGPLPIAIFSSYASLDVEDDTERRRVADQVRRCGAQAVKFNTGNQAASAGAYADRIAAWLEVLPSEVTLLCECHAGISIAEDPAVAASIFDAVGAPPSRLGAIVHTHESADLRRERFQAYGDRIAHVHVNHLDPHTLQAPPLASVPDLAATVDGLFAEGFDGSWSIEFVQGLLTADDRPEALVPHAIEDLQALRTLLEEAS